MASKTLFIGINRYASDEISDLSGARWDAIALDALFADSFPGVQSLLLVDESATMSKVREALEASLAKATEGDEIVVSFSGHGSRDHRLVLHDSDANEPNSMIAMSEIAAMFSASRAKSILLVLDCCFSGEAPARVLDQTPASRGPFDFGIFSGTGRVLIAASRPSEPAWEHGGKGNGFLTKAMIDVMTSAPEPMEMGVAMERILANVQAEAARIGQSQTPVTINYAEGSFVLPALKRGEAFRKAFPEYGGIVVSSDISDLSLFGIGAEIVAAWKERFSVGLNALQVAAINEHRVLDGQNLLTIAPTGAGKTFIGELAAVRAVSQGRRAVFVLPYKSLVNEKYEEFIAIYGKRLGLRVIRCTGDYHDQRGAFVRGKYDLAILTYEMFLNLCLAQPGVVQRSGLVVVDEAQFITEPQRGISVELLMTLVMNAIAGGASIQIIALSAVIGATNSFEQWLRAECLITGERPVPLVEGVVDRTGVFQVTDASGTVRIERILQPFEIVQRKDEPNAQDLIVPLVRKLVRDGETVLVFRNKRGSAEGCAGYLGVDLGLAPAQSALAELGSADPSSSSGKLRECLRHGVAFHDSNLTRDERATIERVFRSQSGELRAMVATTTLAAGINTPASTVFLAENKFVGEDGRPFTVAEYKNMAGRAGRPGFGKPGRAIIYAETPTEREHLFRKYVLGTPEPIVSSFSQDDIETWILRLLAQVKEVHKDSVPRLLANTFFGFTAATKDPNWHVGTEARLGELLQQMLALGLLEEEMGKVRLSLLGRACGQSALSFRSAMRLLALLEDQGAAVDGRNLMMIVQCLPDVDRVYTPVNPRMEKARPSELAYKIGDGMVRGMQRGAGEEKDYLKRCKRGLLLIDWVAGVPVEEIERRYSKPFGGQVGYGDIRGIADNTRYHLGSAAQIAQVLYVTGGPTETEINDLLRCLEVGIPPTALPMLDIGIAWSRGELLALLAAGIATPAQLWSASSATLEAALGARRLAEVASARTNSSQNTQTL